MCTVHTHNNGNGVDFFSSSAPFCLSYLYNIAKSECCKIKNSSMYQTTNIGLS